MEYFKDADFQQWLVNQQGDQQASQTKGYIDSLVDNVLKPNGIDGFTSLLNAPAFCNNEDDFVKYAIESSYFINPIVKEIPMIQDADGNKAVRDLIEDNTGFTVSSGDANFFTNFKISHVWSNAIDLRYFTSLWNIVLIPAWANDLMDKTNSNKTLALKMINTVKAICEKLFPCSAYRNALSISPITSDSKYVVSGTYQLNVLRNKTGDSPIGTIVSQTVNL